MKAQLHDGVPGGESGQSGPDRHCGIPASGLKITY